MNPRFKRTPQVLSTVHKTRFPPGKVNRRSMGNFRILAAQTRVYKLPER